MCSVLVSMNVSSKVLRDGVPEDCLFIQAMFDVLRQTTKFVFVDQESCLRKLSDFSCYSQ